MKPKIKKIFVWIILGVIYFGVMWYILEKASLETTKFIALFLWLVGFPIFVQLRKLSD